MKKYLSIKTGGRKLSATSSSKNVSLNKKGAGVVKATKGGTNQKMGIYGVAQTGPTGPNDSGIATMKKGGSTKMHPITAFRKANEARQAVVKKSLPKAQDGKTTKYLSFKPWESNQQVDSIRPNPSREIQL